MPPDSHRPWKCAVLAVDPGTSCGVAYFKQGVYLDSSVGDGFGMAWISERISAGVWYASLLGLPLVLVMEKPPRGGAPYAGRNPAGVASVLACRKLWERCWLDHEQTVKRLRVDVYPQSWRSAILGCIGGPILVVSEMNRAINLSGKVLHVRDEAAAICVGKWASHAGAVGKLLKGVSR